MNIWSKLLINATLAFCSSAVVVLLHKYFYCERNEVIFFNGKQKLCDSHHGVVTTGKSTCKSSDGNNCSVCKVNRVIEWLNESKKTMDVCMYALNSAIFTDALICANKRGVIVRLIVNEENVRCTWKLGVNGIAKRCKPTHTKNNLMHHKFIIIDNKKIILGSLNWTDAGIERNWENVFLTNEQAIITPFREEFQSLWESFT